MTLAPASERTSKKPVVDGALPPAFQSEHGIINAILSVFVIVSGTVMMGYVAMAHVVAGQREYLERYPVPSIQETALSEILTGNVWEFIGFALLMPGTAFLLLAALMYSSRLWPAMAASFFITLGIASYFMGEHVIR